MEKTLKYIITSFFITFFHFIITFIVFRKVLKRQKYSNFRIVLVSLGICGLRSLAYKCYKCKICICMINRLLSLIKRVIFTLYRAFQPIYCEIVSIIIKIAEKHRTEIRDGLYYILLT